MITTIVKRDGRMVLFDLSKIADAIFKAAQALGGQDQDTAMELAHEVERRLEEEMEQAPSVEHIQDTVEQVLIDAGHARTAKEFILYRSERSRVREMNTRLMKIYEDITYKEAEENDIKRENANIDGDTAMGTMLKYGSEGAKQFYQMFIIDPRFSTAHADGDIHIHDMDFYTLTTTCTQIDLDKLFTGGFCTGHGFLREPSDIRTYSALACIAIQSNQNDQHGGQSIPNFDYAMAKGVRKTYRKQYLLNLGKGLEMLCGLEEGQAQAKKLVRALEEETGKTPLLENGNGFGKLLIERLCDRCEQQVARQIVAFTERNARAETEDATYQAMEALVHNLNTMHSRAGAQIPFSSLNYGLDTSPEGRLAIRSILLATDAGLGNGETAVFPIHIFKVKEGVNYNPGEPNYDLFKLACRVSAKRLFPNFSFIDAPFNLAYYRPGRPETEVAYMGCRTRVIGNHYDPSREIVNGRGNLSFTSVNLPRLAIKANGNLDLFFEMLEDKIQLIADQLIERYRVQAGKKVKNYPFLMGQGVWIDSDKLGPEDTVGEVLKHGTLSLGFIGLAECLKALTGQHHGESPEAQNLGLDIVGYMRKRMDDYTRETGFNYTLIATPAEGLSGRFVKLDRKRYGVIEGVTDRDYYTNSFHVPVYYPISAFEKIRLEAPYHAMTNAGHISYVELDGDPLQNLDAFEAIVRCMKESGIGYGSINHPVDRDPACGYTGIIGDECPHCHRTEADGGARFERIRRITGYLVGTLDRFNNAKRAEERDRVKHSVEF
ncbi:MAG: anaerobic ribonucleoside triphosphate reductase [Provencibacterium sp.]|jgi:anaerobic ribonucleoside-triphosphate reductase|nr:anaerobic ribonucleoside triphosphate reductase [Provencibacterium sp.]